jgi:hypothetical protein
MQSLNGQYNKTDYGPGVDSASNINEFQECSWGKAHPTLKTDNLTAISDPIV